jgi:hypothetical protein
MTVVTTPALAESVDDVMMDVEVASPLMVEVSVFTADERSLLFRKEAVVVAIRPFTVEVSVNELVLVETVRVLEVEDATRLVRSVDVATPLIVEVSVAPEVESEVLVMMLVVAVIPLIVEVRTLPTAPCVKELIIDAMVDDTPFMMSCMKLADDEAVEEVIREVVPMDPPMLEVMVFPEALKELEVERLVTERLTEVALVAVRLEDWRLVDVRDDTEVVARVVVPKATRLVVVALVVVKLVMTEVTAEKSVEKKLVEVAEETERLEDWRVSDTVRLVAEALFKYA